MRLSIELRAYNSVNGFTPDVYHVYRSNFGYVSAYLWIILYGYADGSRTRPPTHHHRRLTILVVVVVVVQLPLIIIIIVLDRRGGVIGNVADRNTKFVRLSAANSV